MRWAGDGAEAEGIPGGIVMTLGGWSCINSVIAGCRAGVRGLIKRGAYCDERTAIMGC